MILPKPDTHCYDEDTKTDCWSYSKELVLSAIAEREAKITELETELSSMAAVIAKKDEALVEIVLGAHGTRWQSETAGEALALTADSVEVVEVGRVQANEADVEWRLEALDEIKEGTKLYTIKVKP